MASRATKTRSPDSNSRNNCHDKRRAADHYGFAALFIELRSFAPFSTRAEPTRASDGGFQGAVAKLKIAFAKAGRCKKQMCFAECPTRHLQRENQRDRLDIPLRRENYPGPPCRWSTGNSAPSVVSRCLLPLWTAGNSGTATIRSQRKRAVAILVTGGHRRHPASGLNWGHRLQKRMAPLFKALIAQSVET